MNWIASIALALGLVSVSLPSIDQEQATADAAAACCYAALADTTEAEPKPKAQPLRALVFGAELCQPCKEMHAAIERDLPGKGWRIGTAAIDHLEFVDAGKDRARATKYGVTATPTTVIVDEAGTQRAKIVGGMSSAFFVQWCEEKGLRVER